MEDVSKQNSEYRQGADVTIGIASYLLSIFQSKTTSCERWQNSYRSDSQLVLKNIALFLKGVLRWDEQGVRRLSARADWALLGCYFLHPHCLFCSSRPEIVICLELSLSMYWLFLRSSARQVESVLRYSRRSPYLSFYPTPSWSGSKGV